VKTPLVAIGGVLQRLRARPEWTFFGVLFRASRAATVAWWALLVLRGAMPALLAIATGVLVAAVRAGSSLTGPLVFVAVVFLAFQVLTPLQQLVSQHLGAIATDWINDRLMVASVSPPGMGHLESPQLADDLSTAREIELGMTGPPLFIAMDFIASGLVQLVAGVVSALVLFAFAWWVPPVLLAAWGSTHWLLRESGVWRDRNTAEVRTAQRHADYAYRLAVDPPAAKELRLFGLAGWVVERFSDRRRHLYDLQWEATRLRERPLLGALGVVIAGNALVFWALAEATLDGRLGLGATTTYLQTAVGVSAVAFGGLSWALDGAAAPAAAVMRLPAAMAAAGALREGDRSAAGRPATEVRFRDVTFGYDTSSRPVLEHLDLTIPAGTSMAIVGVNGAGKTTLAKLLCRLYDPQSGAVELDGIDVREFGVADFRSRVTAVFQDFVRYEMSLRDNVAPGGASDDVVSAALDAAGAGDLAALSTVLARGYDGGVELSGGQWQRVALARALAAVRQGAGVVLLDEPTAQLDVRGESEIFTRILAATRECTTILISHRFSTVRQADRICVLEKGRVVELGSHDELMAQGGRYRTMFDLQASRFTEIDDRGEEVVYESLD
jgi:ATP-binding cassette, subfamily B, bacterial